MFIYLFIFVLSTFCYYVANKDFKGRYIFYFLCILFPSLIAGLRDEWLGSDMTGYVIPFWDKITDCDNLKEAIDALPGTEILYILFNFIISRISDDIHVFMFCHQFLLMLLTVLSANRLRKYFNPTFIVLFYLLFLFNMNLSMARQGIAVMIFLYGSTFLFENKVLYFYLATAIAFLGHSSVIFGALLYPLMLLIKKYQKKKITLFFIITACIIGVFIFYKILFVKLIAMGILSTKYDNYMDQVGFKSHKIDLITFGGILLVLIMITTNKLRNQIIYTYSVFLLYIAFCLTLLGGIVEVADRIAYYVVLPLSFLIPLSTKSSMQRSKIAFFTIALLLVRFIYSAITTGIVETIPYSSKILNI